MVTYNNCCLGLRPALRDLLVYAACEMVVISIGVVKSIDGVNIYRCCEHLVVT